MKSANGAIGEKTTLLETLEREHQKTVREAERIYRLYMDEGLTTQQFKELYNPVDARKKQLEEEMPRVQAEVDLLQIDGFSSEYIMAEIDEIGTSWPTMTPDQRRNLVELLVKKITVGKGEIDISLCYVPTFKEMTNGQRLL